MPWKDIEKQRAAIRRHYYANREVYIEKAQRKRRELRKWLNELKQESPCRDCNTKYPYFVMDFDHIGGKNMEINRLINYGNAKKLKEELSICELVCSNCHRIRTHKRITRASEV
jgi:hypothetical protein